MKKGFWITLGVIFFVEMVLYYMFVATNRDKAFRSKKEKALSIASLKQMSDTADSLPTISQIKGKEGEKKVLEERIQEVKNFMIEKQRDVQFVKGDSDWVYTSDAALTYKNWYNKEADNIINELLSSGIAVAGLPANSQLDPVKSNDTNTVKTKIGLKLWDTNTPSQDEVVSEHRKLELILSVLGTFLKNYKDKPEFSAEVISFGFSEWRKSNSSEVITISFNCEIPFSSINELMNSLEGNDLRMEIISSRVAKKRKDREYSQFPNVEVFFELEFKLFKK